MDGKELALLEPLEITSTRSIRALNCKIDVINLVEKNVILL